MSKRLNKSLEQAVKIADEAIKVAIGDNAFVNMVAGLGTLRDKQTAGQFIAKKRMSVKALNNIYDADWIAERIINKPAYDSIRAGWYYSKIDDDVNQAVIERSKQLKLNKTLLRALALSRLHGWSYILIGANDADDLEQPMSLDVGELQFFTVLTREQCSEYEKNGYLSATETAGSYNEPEFYNIGSSHDPKLIHNSRIIRVEAPDPIGGEDGRPMPVLQRIEDVLKRNASVNVNAGSLVYEAKIDIIKTPKLLSQLRSGLGGAVSHMMKHYASIAQLKGNNGMIVLDADEEYDSKSYSFGGLSDLMREFKVETAGAANMPYALLFGQSPAGMNATGEFDMRSYYDSISMHQEHTLKEPIEQIVMLIATSDGHQIDDVGLVFNPLWQLDDKTRSEVEVANANRDSVYIGLGVVTEAQVARQLVDDGTYTTIDDKHITLLESVARSYEPDDMV